MKMQGKYIILCGGLDASGILTVLNRIGELGGGAGRDLMAFANTACVLNSESWKPCIRADFDRDELNHGSQALYERERLAMYPEYVFLSAKEFLLSTSPALPPLKTEDPYDTAECWKDRGTPAEKLKQTTVPALGGDPLLLLLLL